VVTVATSMREGSLVSHVYGALRSRLLVGVMIGIAVALILTTMKARADLSGPPSQALWALVWDGQHDDPNGVLTLLPSNGATGVRALTNGVGVYVVTFQQDVTHCAFTLTPAILGGRGPGDRVLAGDPPAPGRGWAAGPQLGQMSGTTANPNEALIFAGGEPNIFYVVANCPMGTHN
jgi:hypothetical protein